MLWCREGARADIIGVRAKRGLHLDVEIGVAPDKSRSDLADEAAEDVVGDDELVGLAHGRGSSNGKTKSPGRRRPPGASRFSTLFNVAAIGGK
jgi:hypothetical protein